MQNDFRQIKKKNLTGEYLKDCEFRIPDSGFLTFHKSLQKHGGQ